MIAYGLNTSVIKYILSRCLCLCGDREEVSMPIALPQVPEPRTHRSALLSVPLSFRSPVCTGSANACIGLSAYPSTSLILYSAVNPPELRRMALATIIALDIHDNNNREATQLFRRFKALYNRR